MLAQSANILYNVTQFKKTGAPETPSTS